MSSQNENGGYGNKGRRVRRRMDVKMSIKVDGGIFKESPKRDVIRPL
jgi:hypothetical protein